MKSLMMLTILSFAVSASAFILKAEDGTVEFLAVGRPAAIKILGHTKGPTGTLDAKKSGADVHLQGQAELDLDQIETGIGLRDRHMKEKYLETAKFKQATLSFKDFAVPALTLKNGGEATGPAVLNVHGIEKPVDVRVKFEAAKDGKLTGEFKFKLKLTDHGIEVPRFSGITVADDVEVTAKTSLATTDLGVAL